MATHSVKELLQQWFLEEVREAPAADPRRSAECLLFEELGAAVARSLSAQREEHVSSCDWCTRSITAYAAACQSAPQHETAQSWSLADGGLSSRGARSASAMGRADATLGSARFDEDGTLRVHWQGVPFEGPARVQVVFDDASLTLARGAVQDGVFVAVAPHPELGLRDVDLPDDALRLEPDVEQG